MDESADSGMMRSLILVNNYLLALNKRNPSTPLTIILRYRSPFQSAMSQGLNVAGLSREYI